jgi:peptide methionine sulfoxide reductase MsrB
MLGRASCVLGLSLVAASAQGARVPRAGSSRVSMNLLSSLFGGGRAYGGSAVMGDEALMAQKAHGTSATPVQPNLKWDCDVKVADRICNFNRHFAEYAGYWESTSFIAEAAKANAAITFYDSNTGKPLFVAPRGRSFDEFVAESKSHGWPSFRDNEVVWDNVRVLPDGETVSVDGTHLGHDLPDGKGNRYCINLVCIAGSPK